MKVRTSPNSKFTDIYNIRKAQIQAGDSINIDIKEEEGNLFDTTQDCIIIEQLFNYNYSKVVKPRLFRWSEWGCTDLVKAIKKRLIHSRYKKKERTEVLYNVVQKYVQSETEGDLVDTRNTLILALKPLEKEYLIGYYQLRERSFIRYFTCRLPNLGANLT